MVVVYFLAQQVTHVENVKIDTQITAIAIAANLSTKKALPRLGKVTQSLH